MCLGDWSEHGSGSGGFYQCNKYEKMLKEQTSLKEEEEKRESARNDLKRYMFYYDRFSNHHSGEIKAIALRPKMDDLISGLATENDCTEVDLFFVKESLEEVIKSKSVLKWSYAFSYYIKDLENRELFENMQSLLEKNCDQLQGMIETDI